MKMNYKVGNVKVSYKDIAVEVGELEFNYDIEAKEMKDALYCIKEIVKEIIDEIDDIFELNDPFKNTRYDGAKHCYNEPNNCNRPNNYYNAPNEAHNEEIPFESYENIQNSNKCENRKTSEYNTTLKNKQPTSNIQNNNLIGFQGFPWL